MKTLKILSIVLIAVIIAVLATMNKQETVSEPTVNKTETASESTKSESTQNTVTISAANLTDKNWTNGILNTDSRKILFENEVSTLDKLKKSEKLYCNGVEYNIINLDYNDRWITIVTDKDAKNCMYPTLIELKVNN